MSISATGSSEAQRFAVRALCRRPMKIVLTGATGFVGGEVLLALAGAHPRFSAHCFRPAGILPVRSSRRLHALLAPIVVGVDVLADALIDVATAPGFRRQAPRISNATIKRIAAAR